MAFSVTEFVTSRRVILAKDTESATLEFVGFGSSDDAAARAAFDAAIPATFTAMSNPLARLSFESYTLGGLFWRATAHYGPDPSPILPAVGIAGPPTPVPALPGPNTPLGPNFACDWVGLTEKITQSKETILRQIPGGNATSAPDCKGAIGVTADGKVEGCDRLSPGLEFSFSHTLESVTSDYVEAVEDLIGSANNATFFNRDPGSVIFTGGTCQIDDTLRAKCTFKFLKRRNETTITINPDFVVNPPPGRAFAKLGSEYLWVSYKTDKDGNKMVQVPKAVYVERVVDLMDFSVLRIGV